MICAAFAQENAQKIMYPPAAFVQKNAQKSCAPPHMIFAAFFQEHRRNT